MHVQNFYGDQQYLSSADINFTPIATPYICSYAALVNCIPPSLHIALHVVWSHWFIHLKRSAFAKFKDISK